MEVHPVRHSPNRQDSAAESMAGRQLSLQDLRGLRRDRAQQGPGVRRPRDARRPKRGHRRVDAGTHRAQSARQHPSGRGAAPPEDDGDGHGLFPRVLRACYTREAHAAPVGPAGCRWALGAGSRHRWSPLSPRSDPDLPNGGPKAIRQGMRHSRRWCGDSSLRVAACPTGQGLCSVTLKINGASPTQRIDTVDSGGLAFRQDAPGEPPINARPKPRPFGPLPESRS